MFSLFDNFSKVSKGNTPLQSDDSTNFPAQCKPPEIILNP